MGIPVFLFPEARIKPDGASRDIEPFCYSEMPGGAQ